MSVFVGPVIDRWPVQGTHRPRPILFGIGPSPCCDPTGVSCVWRMDKWMNGCISSFQPFHLILYQLTCGAGWMWTIPVPFGCVSWHDMSLSDLWAIQPPREFAQCDIVAGCQEPVCQLMPRQGATFQHMPVTCIAAVTYTRYSAQYIWSMRVTGRKIFQEDGINYSFVQSQPGNVCLCHRKWHLLRCRPESSAALVTLYLWKVGNLAKTYCWKCMHKQESVKHSIVLWILYISRINQWSKCRSCGVIILYRERSKELKNGLDFMSQNSLWAC